jgi:hypothetical protein
MSSEAGSYKYCSEHFILSKVCYQHSNSRQLMEMSWKGKKHTVRLLQGLMSFLSAETYYTSLIVLHTPREMAFWGRTIMERNRSWAVHDTHKGNCHLIYDYSMHIYQIQRHRFTDKCLMALKALLSRKRQCLDCSASGIVCGINAISMSLY